MKFLLRQTIENWCLFMLFSVYLFYPEFYPVGPAGPVHGRGVTGWYRVTTLVLPAGPGHDRSVTGWYRGTTLVLPAGPGHDRDDTCWYRVTTLVLPAGPGHNRVSPASTGARPWYYRQGRDTIGCNRLVPGHDLGNIGWTGKLTGATP